jgi:hypothetical protein
MSTKRSKVFVLLLASAFIVSTLPAQDHLFHDVGNYAIASAAQ